MEEICIFCEGTIFDGRYKLLRSLGQGAFSEVWLANDEKTQVKVALKIFAPSTGLDNNGLEMFAREFSLVADVNAPNILRPIYFESERKPYLVLQYCKNGSTKKMVRNTTEENAWRIILDVSQGLKELHSHKPNPIVHQDIKPDNIMISDQGHYMITDFGVSVHLHSTLRRTVSSSLNKAGTHAYMAPERFGKQRLIPIMASDIWSLGATVFELLSGEVPFGDEGGLLQQSGVEIPDIPGNYSEILSKTLEDCLAFNSWKRPTAEQLIDIAKSALENEVYLGVKDKETKEPELVPDAEPISEPVPTIEPTPEPNPTQELCSIPGPDLTSQPYSKSKSMLFFLLSALGGIIAGVLLALFI